MTSLDDLFVKEVHLSFTDKMQQYDDEASLLKDAIDWCFEQGYYPIRITDAYHRGYSDLFILVQGRLVVAELKDKDGKPSKHQLEFIEKVQAFGGVGGVCRTIAEIEDLCDEARYY